jgi:hypothetical protein
LGNLLIFGHVEQRLLLALYITIGATASGINVTRAGLRCNHGGAHPEDNHILAYLHPAGLHLPSLRNRADPKLCRQLTGLIKKKKTIEEGGDLAARAVDRECRSLCEWQPLKALGAPCGPAPQYKIFCYSVAECATL